MLTNRTSVIAGLATVAIIGFAEAQLSRSGLVPVEEQVRRFKSMSPAQQEAAIREMQRNMPPATLEAVLKVLRGAGESPKPAPNAPAENLSER
jgi:hypothetical protein